LLPGGCAVVDPGMAIRAASPRQPASGHTGEPAYAVALKPVLQRIFEDSLAPAAAVLVRSPKLGDWSATFGTRRLGGRVPVTIGDHVRIGSNTKTWTGTVLLQLVQEGRLRLDDPVARHLPNVPNGERITIAHLLDMRSGLFNYSESEELNRSLDGNPARVWAPDELLALSYAYPPYFAPGEGYHYSNTNTVLLGLIIEHITGNPIRREFQTRIFDPLRLRQTHFPTRDSAALPAPHPKGYQFGTNLETLSTQALPDGTQAAARRGTLKPVDVTDQNPSWAWTAGAGTSTAEDLAIYVQALVGGGLLNAAMQRMRLNSVHPINSNEPDSPGYGLALARFGPLYGHTGELPGYNCFMGYDPEHQTTVVVWSSLGASPDGRAPAVEMAKAVVEQLYGE
jgi:D-alanyl-D-alanine carboxypeptidase